jgi:hypothetical protein
MEEFLNVLRDVKLVLDSAVVLVEHPGSGEEKKSKVIKIVEDFVRENNVAIPIPSTIFNWMVSEAVDACVRWLNDNFWQKDKTNK